ncbi:MAG TPA: PSD1 and planctomycete cytochrome C domain-containing protein [Chthoniobacteraceae bacterium]|nr:PSD1 and planctomycete cytochrome C domain-containing protein [Chthoniobacteraceae bacterium]
MLVSYAAACAAETAPSPDGLAFFESKVRPVLAEACYKCHSVEAKAQGKLKGALFLDTREGVLAGGDNGPALVPGKPETSLLVKAVRWSDPDIEMPPKHKLAEGAIADLAKWVEMGAPDPRDGAKGNAQREIQVEKSRDFWSFKPLAAPALPEVKNTAWVRSPVDRFILAKQEAAGVQPSAPVSREKLGRRAFFDLTGLPPTPAELEEFLRDEAPDAFAKLVDRLLASPRYGERWGRHWLDVVRFAESNGYEFDGFRPGAYHYRDWVIRAFNDDLPYRDFVRWQLAGDKLAPGTLDGAAATGFLVAGPYPGQITAKTEERIRYDQLDDMLSTIGSSMLGLTVECVRCHEHKFDPIPHPDYYALAATLAQTTNGTELLDPEPAATKTALEAHAAAHQPLVDALRKFEAQELPSRLAKWQPPVAVPAARWQSLEVFEARADKVWLDTEADGAVTFAGRFKAIQSRPGRAQGMDDPNNVAYTLVAHTFQKNLTALRLDAIADKKFPKSGPGLAGDGSFNLTELSVTASPLDEKSTEAPVTLKLTAAQARFAEKTMAIQNTVDGTRATGWRAKDNPGVDNAAAFVIEGGFPGFAGGTVLTFKLDFRVDVIGRLRLALANSPLPERPVVDGKPALEIPEALAGGLEPQHLAELRAMLDAKLAAARPSETIRWFSSFDDESGKLFAAAADHLRQTPRPKLTEVYTSIPGGRDVFVLRRGDVANKEGKSAPGFLQVLATAEPQRWLAAPERDPRVALGDWMTDEEQGAGRLLARVIVNRIWKHHFGRGLATTTNDFGAQGARPTHPELLDYLASELIRGGWKLKPLHRLIMLSAAYAEGSDTSAENQQRDPENKLWWQRPARRLEAEAIRDALLSVGGTLDAKMYGPSETAVESGRRSVYLRVKRSDLIPFLTLFDAPDATHSTGDRGSTTLPTQALTMLNSPFVRGVAGRLAKRALTPDATPETALANVFQIALGRPPLEAEKMRFGAFFAQQKELLGTAEKALTETCVVVLASNEFVFVD